MKLGLSVRQNVTFLQRLGQDALWWGIPMVCVDFIVVPLVGWSTVLVIAIPATIAGVLAKTGIEYLLVRALARRNEIGQHQS
jgi:hypothetical protein